MAKPLLFQIVTKSWRHLAVNVILSLECDPGGMVAHQCKQQHGYELIASPKTFNKDIRLTYYRQR